MSNNTNLIDFGLIPNSDYSHTRVEVKHNKNGWLPLVKTSNKVAYYLDEENNVRRMNLTSLEDVNFVDGEDKTVPEALVDDEGSDNTEIVPGLTTNTNYTGQAYEVNHVDKGWFTLVRTSNKVIFYLDDNGKERKLTLKKFGGVRHISERPVDFDITPDAFYDVFEFDVAC